MSDIMEFANREEFRKWLSDHCLSSDGVWLLFGKALMRKLIRNIFPCAGTRASGQRKIKHWFKALKSADL